LCLRRDVLVEVLMGRRSSIVLRVYWGYASFLYNYAVISNCLPFHAVTARLPHSFVNDR
jgi:hypothetical protein